MSTRGKAPDADAVRADAMLFRLSPHRADRSLNVEHRGRVQWSRPSLRHTVLQHEPGDTARVQPFGDLLTLVIDREIAVAATRTDDDRRAIRLVRGRQIGGERGTIAFR